MPDIINNYHKSKMYMLLCKDEHIKDFYIGHTTNTLTKRKWGHWSSLHLDSKVYRFIREHGGKDNWKIIKIADFKCEDLNEVRKEERRLIELFKPTLNTNIPGRTKSEWRLANLAKIKAYQNEIINCDCGATTTRSHIARHNNSTRHKEKLLIAQSILQI
tara:strand:+ start:240 stop:719 length:480 start_codon:yes stop_codon:yes gene_type:complete